MDEILKVMEKIWTTSGRVEVHQSEEGSKRAVAKRLYLQK